MIINEYKWINIWHDLAKQHDMQRALAQQLVPRHTSPQNLRVVTGASEISNALVGFDLVGGWATPPKNDGVRQLGLLFPVYGK